MVNARTSANSRTKGCLSSVEASSVVFQASGLSAQGQSLLASFRSNPSRVLIEGQNGPRVVSGRAVVEAKAAEHLDGTTRIGLSPTLPVAGRAEGRCWWGALDFDAHDPAIPCRHPEALALVEWLDEVGIVAYWTPSRHGRGAHVFVRFDQPVRQRDLNAWLNGFADAVRRDGHGHVDVFPSSATGISKCIFMPYYGGAALFSVDLAPVPLDKIDANPASVVPHRIEWPPPYWRRSARAGGASRTAVIERLRSEGLIFASRNGVLQAKDGARNELAWRVALDLVRRGGTFAELVKWDAANLPPLQSNEPRALAARWRWAVKRAGIPQRRPRSAARPGGVS